MTMTQTDRAIVVERAGRVIPLMRVTEETQFSALRAYGVRPAIAAAVAARLCYVRVRA
jgi:hypothetical protein